MNKNLGSIALSSHRGKTLDIEAQRITGVVVLLTPRPSASQPGPAVTYLTDKEARQLRDLLITYFAGQEPAK